VTRAEAVQRLRSLGLRERDVETLVEHFADAEARGKPGHGFGRISFLETLAIDPHARPEKRGSDGTIDRWHGGGALGYLVLQAICDDLSAEPPGGARLVVAEACFPTGHLGYWVRRLAARGLVAMLATTSPRRLPPPGGGIPLTGTNPIAIAIPSSTGAPIVADVAMSAVTWGDVLLGRARPEEVVPFGGEQSHKAFALAVGLELLVSAFAGEEHGAVLLAARPFHDPVPSFRALAAGVRLPGDA
jgi:(2R)-3-sulfolactate dehydrogenase (NADP+)